MDELEPGLSDLMKYHRLKGKISEIIRDDKISAVSIEENALILGTIRGFVHVVSFAGHTIRSFRAHKQAVRSVSVDNVGLSVASCSSDGNAVLYALGELEVQEVVVNLNQPLQCICVDKISLSKKDRSFIVGCESGQLIHRKQMWIGKKNVLLFPGANSPVYSIAWRGNIVAWADANHVRLMDVTTQTGLCYVNSPQGVGTNNPFPCHLYWETDCDLLIGWADSFRHLQLYRSDSGGEWKGSFSTDNSSVSGPASSPAPAAAPQVIVRTVADWLTDCIICGISSFDIDHVAILGYFPVFDEGSDDGNSEAIPAQWPELQILRRSTGELVSADTIELRNGSVENVSPHDFKLLCNYQNLSRAQDFTKWSMKTVPVTRGGSRGLSPTLFVVSGLDIVVGRVRDTVDRVENALAQRNIKGAISLAFADKNALRLNQLDELLCLHIEILLQQDNIEEAARECKLLFDKDRSLWEKWIVVFIKRNRLSAIVPYIPTGAPRLSPSIYEMVIDTLLVSNPKSLYETVLKWSGVFPPVFDEDLLLQRLREGTEAKASPPRRGRSKFSSSQSESGDGLGMPARLVDPWCLETQAYLLVLLKEHGKALSCYLSLVESSSELSRDYNEEYADVTDGITGYLDYSFQQYDDGLVAAPPEVVTDGDDFQREQFYGNEETTKITPSPFIKNPSAVFELIEKQNLFDEVRDKLKLLIAISRELSMAFLVKHLDKLPVMLVVKQLKSSRRVLKWYLHSLFAMVPEIYNTVDFAEFHTMQVSLYAQFSPPPKNKLQKMHAKKGGNSDGGDSDFMNFLKTSNFVPLELALRECEQQRPPLYDEIVYLLAKIGNTSEALGILLQEVGDAEKAIEFVEEHDDGSNVLWDQIISFSVNHRGFLLHLLDAIGNISTINPLQLVSKIPSGLELPGLKQRLTRILKQYEFQVTMKEICCSFTEDDTTSLLCQLNQTKRRGIKVILLHA
jgi:hypothetical protein